MIIKKIQLTIAFCQAILTFCFAQTQPNEREWQIYILDTITIDSPILILFTEDRVNDEILLPKSDLISISTKPNISFQDFLVSGKGYRMLSTGTIDYLISHISKKEQNSLYSLLKTDYLVSQTQRKTVHKNGKIVVKEFLGWRYFEVIPKKFFFCLIRGDVVGKYESTENISIENVKNVYIKYLIPMSQ